MNAVHEIPYWREQRAENSRRRFHQVLAEIVEESPQLMPRVEAVVVLFTWLNGNPQGSIFKALRGVYEMARVRVELALRALMEV